MKFWVQNGLALALENMTGMMHSQYGKCKGTFFQNMKIPEDERAVIEDSEVEYSIKMELSVR